MERRDHLQQRLVELQISHDSATPWMLPASKVGGGHTIHPTLYLNRVRKHACEGTSSKDEVEISKCYKRDAHISSFFGQTTNNASHVGFPSRRCGGERRREIDCKDLLRAVEGDLQGSS